MTQKENDALEEKRIQVDVYEGEGGGGVILSLNNVPHDIRTSHAIR